MHRVLAALVAVTVLAAGTAAASTTSDGAPGGETVLARGIQDVVDPDDGTETSGETAYSPGSPSLTNLLLLGPIVGALILGAAALGARIPPRGETPGAGAQGEGNEAGDPRRAPGGTVTAARDPLGDPPPEPPEESPGEAPGAEAGDEPHREPALGLSPGGPLGDERVSESEPGVPRILRLGQQAVEEGDLEEAVEWFETALAADPDLAVAHLCRGLSLEEMGEPEDAAEAFHEAAEADPGNVAARYLLARSLAEAGRTRESLVHLRQVLDLVPELTDVARQDEGFEPLRDDPRFLAALGDL